MTLRSLQCTDLPSSKSHTLSMRMLVIFKFPCLQIMPEVLKSTKSFQVNPQQGDFLRSTLYNIRHKPAQSGNPNVRDLRFQLWVATMRCRLHLEKAEDSKQEEAKCVCVCAPFFTHRVLNSQNTCATANAQKWGHRLETCSELDWTLLYQELSWCCN